MSTAITEVQDVIDAIATVSRTFATSDAYSADAKYDLNMMAFIFREFLREDAPAEFLASVQRHLATKPDLTDEFLNELFAVLKIETIDQLFPAA